MSALVLPIFLGLEEGELQRGERVALRVGTPYSCGEAAVLSRLGMGWARLGDVAWKRGAGGEGRACGLSCGEVARWGEGFLVGRVHPGAKPGPRVITAHWAPRAAGCCAWQGTCWAAALPVECCIG